jgi:alpha-tubulin suppressor-like RCC1 family protein
MPFVTTVSGVQYSGIWTMQQVNAAIAAGTWTGIITNPLFSWGRNNSGNLGLGNTTTYSSPKQVGTLTTWKTIGAGYDHSLAIKSDGTLWAWGAGSFGRLGLGNTTAYSSPKQIGALTSWLNVSGGLYHSVATKTDGTLWTWGSNTQGALGLGNTTNYSSPKQVGALTNWLKVAAGIYACFAIKTDGTMWSWGFNNGSTGVLGINSTILAISSPQQIGSSTQWLNVSTAKQSNGYYTLATTTSGTLYAWGLNGNGQLGLGDTTYRISPVQIGALTNWLTVSCGVYSAQAVKSDGTLWTWGQGSNGQ